MEVLVGSVTLQSVSAGCIMSLLAMYLQDTLFWLAVQVNAQSQALYSYKPTATCHTDQKKRTSCLSHCSTTLSAEHFAGKADSKAMSGTMPKGSSRPGTAKNIRSGTVRPGPTSAALAATANEGLCLQISNKKDERAKKVWCGECMPISYCMLAQPGSLWDVTAMPTHIMSVPGLQRYVMT